MRLKISREAIDGIVAAAAAAHPLEACGLLFGSTHGITGWQIAANVAPNPERAFEIDPGALFAALRAERAGGPPVIGYWHSHPTGRAEPSATDAAMAAPDGRYWLIVAGEDLTVHRAVADRQGKLHFEPITPDPY
jgi:proteasome lid subunit RPN8/RPN11